MSFCLADTGHGLMVMQVSVLPAPMASLPHVWPSEPQSCLDPDVGRIDDGRRLRARTNSSASLRRHFDLLEVLAAVDGDICPCQKTRLARTQVQD